MRGAIGENAVKNFMCGAVAAHGQKVAIALCVCFASELRGVSGGAGSDHVNRQPLRAQLRQLAAGEFARTAAARGG